ILCQALPDVLWLPLRLVWHQFRFVYLQNQCLAEYLLCLGNTHLVLSLGLWPFQLCPERPVERQPHLRLLPSDLPVLPSGYRKRLLCCLSVIPGGQSLRQRSLRFCLSNHRSNRAALLSLPATAV